MISNDDRLAGEKAENKFREYCNLANITYLFVDQNVFTKSSKLIRDQAARPDFLVIEPHKMPFFVDVKAHKMQTSSGQFNFFLNDKNTTAIFFSTNEHLALMQFQSLVGIPVWIVWFERVGINDIRPERMYMCPLNVVNRFFRGIPNWNFLQIPTPCCTSVDMNKPEPLVYNMPEEKIQACSEKLDSYIRGQRLS